MQDRVTGADIPLDERCDIVLRVDELDTDTNPKVAYHAFCSDDWGESVTVTVFEDNRPDVDLKVGHRYAFENVLGERWDDAPAVKFVFDSSVRPLRVDVSGSGRWRLANEIVDGERVDVRLHVDDVDEDTNPKIAYHAFCSDDVDETLIVTVFEDNKPDVDLEAGRRYELGDVVGERWGDGTPGVKFDARSSANEVRSRSPEPDRDGGDRPRDLMIDAVSLGSYEQSNWESTLPPWSGVVMSGAVTAVAVLTSLYAGEVGPFAAVLLVVVALAFAMGSTYVLQYSPLSDRRKAQQRKHANAFLEMLRQDYYELTENVAPIRANVMVAERRGLFSRDRTLSVHSLSGGYKDSELNLDFSLRDKQGPWARAFADETVEVYGVHHRPETFVDLAPEQREIVEYQSSISLPIVTGTGRNRRPIGVLNLGSTEPLDETGFDDERVERLAHRYTELVGEVIR